MTRKTAFFEGWSWFKFNNFGLALGANLKFYTSVEKRVKSKSQKFFWCKSYVCRSNREKIGGGGGAGGCLASPILNKVKNTLSAFDDFKKQKSVWSNAFWYVKVCIFWKRIQYTIYWDKTQVLKKFPSDKIKVQKIPSFFFS